MAAHVDELMEKLSGMKEHVFLLGDGVILRRQIFEGFKGRCRLAPHT